MKFDVGSEMFYLQNCQIFYLLLSGLTYTEIANKYYSRNKNKLLYTVRKLLKELELKNRRQLVFFAFANDLIKIEIDR